MADSEGMQKMLPETDTSNRKYARQPLCARTSYSCNKFFLFIYTLLFVVRVIYVTGHLFTSLMEGGSVRPVRLACSVNCKQPIDYDTLLDMDKLVTQLINSMA